MTCRCNSSNPGRAGTNPEHEYELEWFDPEGGSSWAPYQRAQDYYQNQSRVREVTDANFWNIFYNRNKVLVVDFWATWCPPCDDVAKVMVALANRYSAGPYASLVKFYHVQLDSRVNPKLEQRFGFPYLPVIYFYYTATGKPPTQAAPLLEGSLSGGQLGPQSEEKMYDPNEYIQRVESILRRHGHLSNAPGAPAGSLAENTQVAVRARSCASMDDHICATNLMLGELSREIANKEEQLADKEFWLDRWKCMNWPKGVRQPATVVKTCNDFVARLQQLRQELPALRQREGLLRDELSNLLRMYSFDCANRARRSC